MVVVGGIVGSVLNPFFCPVPLNEKMRLFFSVSFDFCCVAIIFYFEIMTLSSPLLKCYTNRHTT